MLPRMPILRALLAVLFATLVVAMPAQARSAHARIARVASPVGTMAGVRVDLDWPAGATLILSTDGLKTTQRTPEPPAIFHRAPIVTAATILERRRRNTDDSGIVVVKG